MAKQYAFSSSRTGKLKNIKKQKAKFPKIAKDIIRISDVILQILDARFIEETRNLELEKMIKTQGKKIIYIFNKSDLVKVKKGGWKGLKPYVYVSARNRTGIRELRIKIKAMVKKLDIGWKRAHVGIIGYPNTGKSSLINLLTGKSSAKTGAEAGFTKGMQKIRLTSDILLLDTPGVIPESEYSHTRIEAIQKQAKVGARTIDKIRDPEIVVIELMKKNLKDIEKFYGVSSKGDVDNLIEKVGKKMNFLKKGGVIDEDRTARQIIRDWQTGKIRI